MRVLITAGPTREYLDPVRFLTNASSGKMGYAVAAAARGAGHEVTLLSGPVGLAGPEGCEVVAFVSVEDLRRELDGRFDGCDALVMAAAVGDFRPEKRRPEKIPRAGGGFTLRLIPTEDVLASVAARKRGDQIVVAFAVEDGPPEKIEEKVRAEVAAKHADYTVVNSPAAIAAERSEARVLSPGGVALPSAMRTKEDLAREIVALLERPSGGD